MIVKNFNIYLRYLIGLSVIIGLIYHIHSKENILPILIMFELDKILYAFIIICFHLQNLVIYTALMEKLVR